MNGNVLLKTDFSWVKLQPKPIGEFKTRIYLMLYRYLKHTHQCNQLINQKWISWIFYTDASVITNTIFLCLDFSPLCSALDFLFCFDFWCVWFFLRQGLTVYPRLTLNSLSYCFHIWGAGVIGHAQPCQAHSCLLKFFLTFKAYPKTSSSLAGVLVCL
jgi:hypothetical protein